jgi:adenylate cyclase class 2
MATEIELKARTADPRALMERIDSFAEPLGSYIKEDAYWRPAAIPHGAGPKSLNSLGSGVRIRKDAWNDAEARWMVNFKRKEVRDGIEVNDEREFAVSDIGAFEELLERLGLRMWMRKRKSGRAWRFADMTIEVSEIAGLGWFAELEILAADDGESTVAAARKLLLDMLDRLDIPKKSIEERYYTEMLASLVQGSALGQGASH